MSDVEVGVGVGGNIEKNPTFSSQAPERTIFVFAKQCFLTPLKEGSDPNFMF